MMWVEVKDTGLSILAHLQNCKTYVSTQAPFDARPRDPSQLCPLDQHSLHPVAAPEWTDGTPGLSGHLSVNKPCSSWNVFI